jgi:hypothetical protein
MVLAKNSVTAPSDFDFGVEGLGFIREQRYLAGSEELLYRVGARNRIDQLVPFAAHRSEGELLAAPVNNS